jgi:hypothetical protein
MAFLTSLLFSAMGSYSFHVVLDEDTDADLSRFVAPHSVLLEVERVVHDLVVAHGRVVSRQRPTVGPGDRFEQTPVLAVFDSVLDEPVPVPGVTKPPPRSAGEADVGVLDGVLLNGHVVALEDENSGGDGTFVAVSVVGDRVVSHRSLGSESDLDAVRSPRLADSV